MTNADVQTKPFGSQRSALAAQSLHDDIRDRWSKLTDFEVGALRDTDDLVDRVVRLYTLDREQVRRDVDLLLDGRSV